MMEIWIAGAVFLFVIAPGASSICQEIAKQIFINPIASELAKQSPAISRQLFEETAKVATANVATNVASNAASDVASEVASDVAKDVAKETGSKSLFSVPSVGTCVKVAAKVGATMYFGPWGGFGVDMVSAAVDAGTGNYVGAAVTIITSPLNFWNPFGTPAGVPVDDAAKEAVEEAAKQVGKDAAVEAVQEESKQMINEASKAIGHRIGKEIATNGLSGAAKEELVEMGKESAKQFAKETHKAAGAALSKRIAQGGIDQALKEAFEEGSEMTVVNAMKESLVTAGLVDVNAGVESIVDNGLAMAVKQVGDKMVTKPIEHVSMQAAKEAIKNHLIDETEEMAAGTIMNNVVRKATDKYIQTAVGKTTEEIGRQLLNQALNDPAKWKYVIDFFAAACL